MSENNLLVVKRPRGRPRKIRPEEKNPPQLIISGSTTPTAPKIPCIILPAASSVSAISSRASSKRPRDAKITSPQCSPPKRPRIESSNSSSTSSEQGSGTARVGNLPSRRSSRQATVYNTQLSEGNIRPPGPAHLEAALSIAIRNLQSETWRYLWIYREERKGEPLPSPGDIKEKCWRVRKAAKAVDAADKDIEDALSIEGVINGRKKGGV
ncbi:hypothetical protein BU17DRAFT_64847 [Hysterangium stoloniferum]|nr:hypothetical protein BU17DRAFT_64847 [Hysterangium stoloniferum]